MILRVDIALWKKLLSTDRFRSHIYEGRSLISTSLAIVATSYRECRAQMPKMPKKCQKGRPGPAGPGRPFWHFFGILGILGPALPVTGRYNRNTSQELKIGGARCAISRYDAESWQFCSLELNIVCNHIL